MLMEFGQFILEHSQDDPAQLALSRARFAGAVTDFDLALTTLEVRRKLRDKVPEWYAVPSLRFPLRLSGEQCSSTSTARYKASVAVALGSVAADLTPQPALSAQNACCHVSSDAAAGTSPKKRLLSGSPSTNGASPVLDPSQNPLSSTNGASLVLEPSQNPLSSTNGASPVLELSQNPNSCTDYAPFVHGGRSADLTGGLGVDSWAFAQVFDQVLYNEMRPELAAAAAHNFRELGLTNITVRNFALVPAASAAPDSSSCPAPTDPSCPAPTGHPLIAGSDPGSPSASVFQILGDFRPDVVFLDPARRASDGRKVFRLEDCQPDVLQLLPELLAACPRILLKLSPMADITLVCKQLGCVKAVHVVAADGECKELLLVLEKDWSGPHTLTIVEDGAVVDVTDFCPSTAKTYQNCGRRHDFSDVYHAQPGSALFEPGKALLKAGAFDLPCQFGLTKLGQHTHLYTGEEIPEALQPFGKCFRIIEMAPLDKRSIKAFGQQYPQAEVTARNIPLTSDQLRAKLGVRSGGTVHIFGLHSDALRSNLLLATERL